LTHFRKDNLSRALEGCTATSTRHYLAGSLQTIENFIGSGNFRALLKFVLDTIIYTLREQLVKVKEVGKLAKSADDLVMVELCAVHGVISYPDFIQIVQVINVSNIKHNNETILEYG
jgi:hypothetical protein